MCSYNSLIIWMLSNRECYNQHCFKIVCFNCWLFRAETMVPRSKATGNYASTSHVVTRRPPLPTSAGVESFRFVSYFGLVTGFVNWLSMTMCYSQRKKCPVSYIIHCLALYLSLMTCSSVKEWGFSGSLPHWEVDCSSEELFFKCRLCISGMRIYIYMMLSKTFLFVNYWI